MKKVNYFKFEIGQAVQFIDDPERINGRRPVYYVKDRIVEESTDGEFNLYFLSWGMCASENEIEFIKQ